MNIQVTNEDIQAVIQANPAVALQVENQALRRKLQATTIAFDAAMTENKRLTKVLGEDELQIEEVLDGSNSYVAIGRFDEDKEK
tara:strand:+ start:285 stop:536 length:252 start_codon:yes stop_codon:yes gene_type:complete